MSKVTCTILTYNEESRVRIALTHALKWADEVLVIDKGSGDNTCDIAREMGAHVYTIPFSKQGHEDIASYCHYAMHDWVWGFTPGEVPQRKCIENALKLATDDSDVVVIPHKYYSFGQHHKDSPWYYSGQLRLFCSIVAALSLPASRTLRLTRQNAAAFAWRWRMAMSCTRRTPTRKASCVRTLII